MKNKLKKLLAISLTTLSLSCAAFSMNVSAYGGTKSFSGTTISATASIDRTSRQASSSTTSNNSSVNNIVAYIDGFSSNGTVHSASRAATRGTIYTSVTTTTSNPYTSARSDHHVSATSEFIRTSMSA